MSTLEELQNLFRTIYDPINQKNIEYRLAQSLDLWKEKYKIIKDQSWPPCDCLDDFSKLPLEVQKECTNIHKFSPEIWMECIIQDQTTNFHLVPTSLQTQIVNENLDCIKDKHVVDFACGHGGYSVACCQAGAKSVIGFDIRETNLQIAKAFQQFFEISEKQLEFIKLDIHAHDKITDLCCSKNTVLMNGIMYHVHDHYDILSAVARSQVQNIIIETGEADSIVNKSEPLIWWRYEADISNLDGWHDNNEQVLVGYPNLSWFNLILKNLGYDLISSKQYNSTVSKNHSQEFQITRSIHVFKKIDTNGHHVV